MKPEMQGYGFAILAVSIFAAQDGFTKHLGQHYRPEMLTMIRFWAFAVFVVILAWRSPQGVAGALKTKRPALQIFRALLLVFNIFAAVISFRTVGLATSQAILQSTPLFVTALSFFFLGEHVGWRRGAAILAGLAGVLIILDPFGIHFEVAVLLPLVSTFAYAVYIVATRAASRHDSLTTSALYTGLIGTVVTSVIGPFFWQPINAADYGPLLGLCLCGAVSHYFLMRAYALIEAIKVQPLTYVQLPLGTAIAVVIFGETISWNMIVGALIIVAAGLFTVWREYITTRREPAFPETQEGSGATL